MLLYKEPTTEVQLLCSEAPMITMTWMTEILHTHAISIQCSTMETFLTRTTNKPEIITSTAAFAYL